MLHRFFLNNDDVVEEGTVVVRNPDLYFQLTKVLRCKVGARFAFIVEGEEELEVLVKEIIKKEIVVSVESRRQLDPEKYEINLFFGMLKSPEKNELILQKGVELGVTAFYPMVTERTEREFLPKPSRLVRIIREAAEQCGRSVVPRLREPVVMRKVECEGERLFCELSATEKMIEVGLVGDVINIFVGPEGGFSEAEVEWASNEGMRLVSLGGNTLRAETASIVALGVLNQIL